MRISPLIAAMAFLTLAGTNFAQPRREIAFDRIIHDWTNYSSAFNATLSADASGSFATIASHYTPGCDALLDEYRVILIWEGSVGDQVDFTNFDFRVMVWSGLTAFTNSPAQGDIATVFFSAASSPPTADATTRGGRRAYELRFSLAEKGILLNHGRPFLVGFGARNHLQGYPDLFVPTSSHPGESDLQAGNILITGWIEVANAGGSTVYSGQLAAALDVQSVSEPPVLNIELTSQGIGLAWSTAGGCFHLETCFIPGRWLPVSATPVTDGEILKLELPTSSEAQWFRLAR